MLLLKLLLLVTEDNLGECEKESEVTSKRKNYQKLIEKIGI